MAQQFGSFVNLLYSRGKDVEPKVGMGVTQCCWSDRHAYEIIEVTDDRHIVVRALDSKRTDNNGMSDMQEYEYFSNPNNSIAYLFKTKQGRWVQRVGRQYINGYHWCIGFAEEYYDYTF